MTKSKYLPFLFAGLLAAAGVHAQSTSAAGSSDGPPKAGEASNQTMGVPNAQTTNSTAGEAVQSKDAVRQEAQGMGAAAATSSVPPKAGEASTFTQGQPNIDPNAAPRALTRQEVVAELMERRATFEAHRRDMLNPYARMGATGGATTQ